MPSFVCSNKTPFGMVRCGGVNRRRTLAPDRNTHLYDEEWQEEIDPINNKLKAESLLFET